MKRTEQDTATVEQPVPATGRAVEETRRSHARDVWFWPVLVLAVAGTLGLVVWVVALLDEPADVPVSETGPSAYTGDWKDTVSASAGTVTSTYTGEWKDSLGASAGTTTTSSSTYTGDWKDSLGASAGTTTTSSSTYTGDWKDSLGATP
jgi:nitrate reductase NapE component